MLELRHEQHWLFVFWVHLFMAAFPSHSIGDEPRNLENEFVHNELQTEDMSAIEREVWRVIEDWNAAFAANDAEKYFSFVDERITVMTSSNPYRVEGLLDDREEYEFGLQRGYSRVSLFQEIAPVVRVFGDSAVATYFNRGFYGPEDSGKLVYLKETNVLVRRENEWKIIHIHVSD